MYKQLIIDTCREYKLNFEEAAYVLATTDLETNGTFKPVREAYWLKNAEAYRKKLRYYPYYGRGFVQLTWDRNYLKASKFFGVDFVAAPDKVMEPEYAAKILVIGSRDGWFTGKKLSDYVDGVDESAKEDFLEYYNARRVINGMDRANDIAQLAEKYELELKAIGYGVEAPKKPVQPVPTPVSGDGSSHWLTWLLGLLFGKLFK
jgi:putative chitinase